MAIQSLQETRSFVTKSNSQRLTLINWCAISGVMSIARWKHSRAAAVLPAFKKASAFVLFSLRLLDIVKRCGNAIVFTARAGDSSVNIQIVNAYTRKRFWPEVTDSAKPSRCLWCPSKSLLTQLFWIPPLPSMVGGHHQRPWPAGHYGIAACRFETCRSRCAWKFSEKDVNFFQHPEGLSR